MARLRTLALTASAWSILLAACGGDSAGPDGGEPSAIAVVSGDNQTGRVGEALAAPLVARITDARGQPVGGATVTFSVASGGGSLTATVVTSAADGTAQTSWTLGTRVADAQQAQGSVSTAAGARNVTFRATPSPGNPASVAVASGNNQSRGPGTELAEPIAALVADAFGNPVPGVQVAWSVTAGGGTVTPAASVTDASGIARATWTLGQSVGGHAAQAAVTGLTTVAAFAAQAVPAPTITEITPSPVVPGAIATITGTNFSTVLTENAVTFNGTQAGIQQATTTTLTVVVPCAASGNATVVVSTRGIPAQRAHPLSVPGPIALTPGQSLLLDAGGVCRELTNGGRYLMAVVNATTGPGSTGFRLRGAGPPSAPAAAHAAQAPAAPVALTGELRDAARQLEARERILDRNLELIERLGPPPRVTAAEPGAIAAQLSGAQIAVNDTLTLKIPDIEGNLCSTEATVRARVVFVGAHGVILEDIASPLAGTLDATWQQLGQEFESVQWPILTGSFGDPLAYDAQTDANGKLFMLFSRVVNDFDSAPGFVTSGNYYPAALCSSSNNAEIFFGVVPTVAGDSYGNGTADNPLNWLRTIRPLIIHEVKHLAAFSERFARNGAANPNFEDRWLEESSAVLAEELYARAVFGYTQNSNANFDATLYCERRPDPTVHPTQCWHKPFVMYIYYALVYQYLSTMEALTPLGESGQDDQSFYGSAWFLLRWAADQFAAGGEAAFFKALTQESVLRGMDNLEQRTGRSTVELLSDFALAAALDDRAGVVNQQAVHTIPSWNTRDIFARMNGELPTLFPATFPLTPRPLVYGAFDVQIQALRAGTSALFELSGTAAGAQLLHLSDAISGGAPAPTLRLKIVRIE
jgi:hypothetical protein